MYLPVLQIRSLCFLCVKLFNIATGGKSFISRFNPKISRCLASRGGVRLFLGHCPQQLVYVMKLSPQLLCLCDSARFGHLYDDDCRKKEVYHIRTCSWRHGNGMDFEAVMLQIGLNV